MKERARRFKEQELVSKVVKQQEDIKKKQREKKIGEEAYERKQEQILKPLLKTPQLKMEAPVSTTIEYSPKKLQMLKSFSQMTEQELEDIEELEYDEEGLFQELEKVNQPPLILL